MSYNIDSDSFHTKKGDRRKTARKAFQDLEKGKRKRVSVISATARLRNFIMNGEIERAQNELQELRYNWTWLSV